MSELRFASLDEAVSYLRNALQNGVGDKQKIIHQVLLFAFNGTGKTRLSMAFKEAGKNNDARDTLYFNAFTEDLFSWDNDLNNDTQRVLRINQQSRFFDGLQTLEMESRIRPLLERYADFNFVINYNNWSVLFYREIDNDNNPLPIKVSRGEENIFVWCFFLAVAQLAVDADEGSAYH